MASKGGPKTSEGKAVSAQNSRKHGLTAKGFISTKEQTAHKLLTESLINEYQPHGVIEVLLIQDLAMIRIQLDRFKDVEAALFTNSQSKATSAQSLVDYLGIENSETRAELIEAINTGATFSGDKLKVESEWLKQVEMLTNSEEPLSVNCKALIKEKLREECIAENMKPLELIEELEKKHRNLSAPVRVIHIIPMTHESVALQKSERNEQLEKLEDYQLLDFVSAKRVDNHQIVKKERLLQAALNQKEALVDAAMPAQGELDRLYRYRTTLEKQFTSKLSQIIQLQEIRAKKERLGQEAKS